MKPEVKLLVQGYDVIIDESRVGDVTDSGDYGHQFTPHDGASFTAAELTAIAKQMREMDKD